MNTHPLRERWLVLTAPAGALVAHVVGDAVASSAGRVASDGHAHSHEASVAAALRASVHGHLPWTLGAALVLAATIGVTAHRAGFRPRWRDLPALLTAQATAFLILESIEGLASGQGAAALIAAPVAAGLAAQAVTALAVIASGIVLADGPRERLASLPAPERRAPAATVQTPRRSLLDWPAISGRAPPVAWQL